MTGYRRSPDQGRETVEVFSDYVCPFCYLAEQLARLINGSPSQGPRPLR
jgi:predicted DsbA family dithiol-disulfide isomerase